MLWIPGAKSNYPVVTNGGIVGAAAPWTGVASGGSTNTYGASPTELISAADNVRDSWGISILITATGASATARQATVDILVGGATDDVLISSLICGYATNATTSAGYHSYFFPVHIPAGLRIAAQHSNVTATVTAQVAISLHGNGVPPFRVGRKVTTYGTKIDNSRGKAVTPTASGGTASVTEMTASSTSDHFYFLPGFQPAGDSTLLNGGWHNIGVGVGASTEQRIGTWWYQQGTNETIVGPTPSLGAFTEVQSGQRLSLLASNFAANDSGYDGHIYAVG